MPYQEVDGVRIYYELFGEGPDLLFIPGLFSTVEMYRSLAGILGEKHRVHIIDLPMHGRSGKPEEATLESIACLLRGFMRVRGIRKPLLMGHSAGGVLAARIADSAECLVLICPAGVLQYGYGLYIRMLVKNAYSFCAHPVVMSPVILQSLKQFLHSQKERGFRLLLRRARNESIVPLLQELDCPVAIILAERDILFPKRKMLCALEGLNVEVLPGTHELPLLQPAAVAESAKRLISQASPYNS